MKPRIALIDGRWYCMDFHRGCGCLGVGVTPLEAYDAWDAEVERKMDRNFEWLKKLDRLLTREGARPCTTK